MTTHENEKEWVENMIAPGRGPYTLMDIIVSRLYHEQVLHAAEKRELEDRSVAVRGTGKVLRRLTKFMVSLRPGLQEFLDERHTWQGPHRYSRYPLDL